MNTSKLNQLTQQFHIHRRKHVRTLKKASNHPLAVPVLTFVSLGLLVGMVTGLVVIFKPARQTLATRVVIVSHDGVEQTVPSNEPTVGTLIKKLNIAINEGDVIEPAPTTKIEQDDFRINIYRAVPVQIVDNGHVTFTYSAATTSRSITKQAGIAAYPEDTLTTQPVTNFVKQRAIGEQVVIDRATPVAVNLYGTNITMRTHAKTVGELMKDRGIKLAKDDTLTPAANTIITASMPIYIDRHGVRVETVTEDIAMPTQTIDDNSLAYGTSAVRQQGSPGKKTTTYQIQLQNGQEVGRVAIQTVVTQQPVTQIVVRGTSLSGIKGDMALAGISPGDYNYVDYIVSHESGWCPTKAQGEHTCPAVPDNQYTSGGYGLCQATPGTKMATAGSDWATNPVTQLRWCNGYAVGRYGSWGAAYNHWLSYHNW